MESVRGYFENAATMDLGDAIDFWDTAGPNRFDHNCAAFLSIHARVFLFAEVTARTRTRSGS